MASLRYITYKLLECHTILDCIRKSLAEDHLSPMHPTIFTQGTLLFSNITSFNPIGKSVKGTYFERDRFTDRGDSVSSWFTFNEHGHKYHLWHRKVGFCRDGELVPVFTSDYVFNHQCEVSISEEWLEHSKGVITANCFREAQKEATLSSILDQLAHFVDEGVGELYVDEEFKRGVRLLTNSTKRMFERRDPAESSSDETYF